LPLEAEVCPWCRTPVAEAAEPPAVETTKDQNTGLPIFTREESKTEKIGPGIMAKSAWYFKYEYLVLCPKHSRFGIHSAVKLSQVFCPACGMLCNIELVLLVS